MILRFEIRGRSKLAVLNCLKEVAKYNNIELDEKNLENAVEKYGISDFMIKPTEISYGKSSTYDQKFYKELSVKTECMISVYNDNDKVYATYHNGKLDFTEDNLIHDLDFDE